MKTRDSVRFLTGALVHVHPTRCMLDGRSLREILDQSALTRSTWAILGQLDFVSKLPLTSLRFIVGAGELCSEETKLE